MLEYLKPAALVGSLVYSILGVFFVVIAFIVIDRLTPYDLWKELVEHRNQALATVVAAMCIAVSIIVAAAIHG
jgi:putative membrane protein